MVRGRWTSRRRRVSGPSRVLSGLLALCLATAGIVGTLVTTGSTAHAGDGPQARGIERVCPPPTPADDGAEDALPQDSGSGSAGTADGGGPADADADDGSGAASGEDAADGGGDAGDPDGDAADAGGDAGDPGGDAAAPDGDAAAPDGDVGPVFSDLDSTHGTAVECAAGYGLVSGFNDGSFRPGDQITREQMATFVAAWLRVATGAALPRPDGSRFEDAFGSVHRGSIEALAGVGIVSGLRDGTFGTQQPVTRGQFARTVANAISYADVIAVGGPLPPPGEPGVFDDAVGTTFQEPIEALAGIGVAVGMGPSSFSPSATVTRGQLATFLLRAADYLDDLQRWKPTAMAPVALEADLFALEPADGSGDEGAGDDPQDGTDDDAGDGGGADGDGGLAGEGNGEGVDDGAGDPEDDIGAPRIVGSVALTIDAFGAVLAYEAELHELVGSEEAVGTLSLHRLDRSGLPVEVLEIVAAVEPGPAVSGEVFELASSERFADLLRPGETLLVRVTTADRPEGVAQGVLRAPTE